MFLSIKCRTRRLRRFHSFSFITVYKDVNISNIISSKTSRSIFLEKDIDWTNHHQQMSFILFYINVMSLQIYMHPGPLSVRPATITRFDLYYRLESLTQRSSYRPSSTTQSRTPTQAWRKLRLSLAKKSGTLWTRWAMTKTWRRGRGRDCRLLRLLRSQARWD